MDPLRHVKPSVRALAAYTLALREAPVKINQNENPWDLPEAVKRRVLERALARPWSRYPDFDPKELLEALARFSGWRADGILAGNGSNEAIEALLLVTVSPGTKVVIPEPTFTLYALMTTILGGEPTPSRGALKVTRASGSPGTHAPSFVYDVEALLESLKESQASVTIVCSPNNPTGTSLAPADVERLCRASDSLVVVDEAYHEFSGETVVPLLERNPNLVVLRTFSKAMALAGLRVGYLLASPELVREINKARLPYNVNFFSQMAAIAAIEEKDVLATSVRRLVAERERLLARLADVPGVRAFPSHANFFLLECLSADPKAVFASMLRRGVLVRDVTSYPMLSRCLRVSVGTEAENDAFLHALGTALTEAGMDQTTGRA
ncbi:MAG TPA: histidinol-phosphate transaminase [Vicinamibacteria bacterium]|nr:histidinol-phosphate transaminase [Vicinamibacteria bacterium]